jgi:hypothetical protein
LPAIPFREWSAAATLLQKQWIRWSTRLREGDAATVTRVIVAEMHRRCRDAGVAFSLVLLSDPLARLNPVIAFARARGIDVIDCHRPVTPADHVPGEVHPNGKLQKEWGDCVARAATVAAAPAKR